VRKQVSVTIVTFDSGAYIRACLDSLLCQTGVDFDVVVVDNNSSDRTREILEGFADRVRIFHNPRNVGFAAAQNQAIAATSGDWVLTLNPDAVLQPRFLERLLQSGESDDRVGTVCGKLLSISSDLKPSSTSAIDSAGIVFTPGIRHFDRGCQEADL
jgi:GT2 family glycosyltransferase